MLRNVKTRATGMSLNDYPLTIKPLNTENWGDMLRNPSVFAPVGYRWGDMLRNPDGRPVAI